MANRRRKSFKTEPSKRLKSDQISAKYRDQLETPGERLFDPIFEN